MPTARKAGGYAHKREINRAKRANRAARDAVRRILDEKPGNGRLYQLIAEVAQALGTELDALTEMEEIIDKLIFAEEITADEESSR